MLVRNVMTQGCACIPPDSTLQQAADKMRALDVGLLPVSEDDRLIGMLTDRDITVRAVAEGRDPCTARVRDAMTTGIDYCFDDEDVIEATRHMQEKQIRRLPVLDRNKRLVGMLSLGDVAVRTDDEQLVGQTLERVSEPAKQS